MVTESGTQSVASRVAKSARRGLRDLRYAPSILRDRSQRWYLSHRPVESSRSVLTGFDYFHVISRHVPFPAAIMRTHVVDSSRFTETSKRQLLSEMVGDVNWPLARLALMWLPWWYVEGFSSIFSSIEVTGKKKSEIHTSYLPGIDVRMFVAKSVSHGSKLCVYQHSVGYGEVKEHVKYHAESSLADRFHTWGWKLREGDEPFVALRLMKPARQKFCPGSKSGYWVYAIVREHRPNYAIITLDLQRRFFSTLRHKDIARTVIRPRTQRGGSPELQVWPQIRSSVKAIDDGRSNMADVVRGAEIVILDSFPSSIFMECASAGLPVVAIVPDAIAFTDLASRFYVEFAHIGVLHHTAESAANFVSRTSIRAWWREVQSMDVFQTFLRTYCNCEAPSPTN
jgi:putative transferase (TIGR04331 family)